MNTQNVPTPEKIREGTGVLYADAPFFIFGRALVDEFIRMQFSNPTVKPRKLQGPPYMDAAAKAGARWHGRTDLGPARIVELLMSGSKKSGYAKVEWLWSAATFERVTRTSTQVDADETTSNVEEELTSALSYAQALIRASGIRLGDAAGVKQVLMSRIGNVPSFLKLAMTNMDPDIVRVYGKEAQAEIIRRPVLQAVLKNHNVNVDFIINLPK